MQIETIDHFPDAIDEVALQSPESTFYHTSVWLRSVDAAFADLHPRCLIARDRSEILGYLPYFLFRKGPVQAAWSLPFGTFGGPVGLGNQDVLRALTVGYTRLQRRLNVHDLDLVDFSNSLEIPSFRVESISTHVIPLGDTFDQTWETLFEKSKRRQTRRAIKQGLTVSEAHSEDEVLLFHAIYKQRIAAWGERFTYPAKIFTELFARGGQMIKLFVVRQDDEVLGGHLNFYFKDAVIAWNGVVRDLGDGTQSGTLLYAECIKDACERGYRSYNLGGSLGKKSLEEYKESLGGERRRYRRLRWRSPVGRFAARLKDLIPLR